MTDSTAISTAQRKILLRAAAEGYFRGLARNDFALIPFDDHVVFRASLTPGGVGVPIVGKEALRSIWWPPLSAALGEVKVLEHYFNESMTAVMTEAEVHTVHPKAIILVANRFAINDAGMIVNQQNHYDPRDVTNPGWQNA